LIFPYVKIIGLWYLKAAFDLLEFLIHGGFMKLSQYKFILLVTKFIITNLMHNLKKNFWTPNPASNPFSIVGGASNLTCKYILLIIWFSSVYI